jgi:hypothetical protein
MMNIKTDLRDISCEDIGWINLAQVRVQWLTLAKTLMNLQALYPTCGEFLE